MAKIIKKIQRLEYNGECYCNITGCDYFKFVRYGGYNHPYCRLHETALKDDDKKHYINSYTDCANNSEIHRWLLDKLRKKYRIVESSYRTVK